MSRCTRLRRLNLNGLKAVTDGTLEAVAQHSEQLVELEMKECFLITDEGLHHLAHGRTHRLETFNFEYCSKVSDAGLASLCALAARRKESGSGAPVRILNLGHLPHLTSRSLELIAQHVGDDLHSLNLSQCALVKEEAVLNVLHSCRELKVINVKYLPALTDRLLEDVMAHDGYRLRKLLIFAGYFSEECLRRLVACKRASLVINLADAISTLPSPTGQQQGGE